MTCNDAMDYVKNGYVASRDAWVYWKMLFPVDTYGEYQFRISVSCNEDGKLERWKPNLNDLNAEDWFVM